MFLENSNCACWIRLNTGVVTLHDKKGHGDMDMSKLFIATGAISRMPESYAAN